MGDKTALGDIMPWGEIVKEASPYSIAIILIWLLYQMIKVVTSQNVTIKEAAIAQTQAAEAIRAAQQSIQMLCSRHEKLENILDEHDEKTTSVFKNLFELEKANREHLSEYNKMLGEIKDGRR